MEASFTKISEDILVPSKMIEMKDGIPLKYNAWFLWVLGGLWLFGISTVLKFGWQGVGLITGIVFCIAMIGYVIQSLPSGWLELNRKDGTITGWTSYKKRRKLYQGKFSDFRLDWVRHYVQTNKYSGDYRYSIGLYPVHGKKRYRNSLMDGKQEVQFCFIDDIAAFDSTKMTAGSDKSAIAESVTKKVEAFLNDFFNGKQLPPSKTNVFTFSV